MIIGEEGFAISVLFKCDLLSLMRIDIMCLVSWPISARYYANHCLGKRFEMIFHVVFCHIKCAKTL